jgi:hypothetical protein
MGPRNSIFEQVRCSIHEVARALETEVQVGKRAIGTFPVVRRLEQRGRTVAVDVLVDPDSVAEIVVPVDRCAVGGAV